MSDGSRGLGRWLVLVTVLAAGVACGTQGPAPTGPAPASSPAAAPTAPPTRAETPADRAGSAALEAYRGMWADFAEAGRTSDWQSSKLGQHATGYALTNMSRVLYANQANGVVSKGEPKLDPSVSSMKPADDPTSVTVGDCGDSTDFLTYRVSDGKLADDTPGGRRKISAVVDRQSDGSWKVSDFAIRDIGTC